MSGSRYLARGQFQEQTMDVVASAMFRVSSLTTAIRVRNTPSILVFNSCFLPLFLNVFPLILYSLLFAYFAYAFGSVLFCYSYWGFFLMAHCHAFPGFFLCPTSNLTLTEAVASGRFNSNLKSTSIHSWLQSS